ncbi:antibiotic biosynthesis monooxygenase family protein [Sphingomonas sp.]|jgi:heme-degrading monooxygenase HmoA|uniref:antibiotic biosynthesis monooxygenase family protein n=1 Tax=Sphingomonas sp. TaxID=28214 RepID=UPI002ED8AD1D
MDENAKADRTGQIAVIFIATRTPADDEGYAQAAAAMDARAARQPGYRGIDSARDAAGFGITVSWWADEAAAVAWREDAAHAAIRATGRARWYVSYEVAVAGVTRSYAWCRA